MPRSVRIPDRDQITDDTPLHLETAAVLAFPDGCVSGKDLARAVREERLEHYKMRGVTMTTLRWLGEMADGPRIPVPQQGDGIVYVVGFGPYIKIGFTAGDVDRRVAELSTGCPEQIEIFAAIAGPPRWERWLHRRFAHLRLRGEWFRREAEIADWIVEGCPVDAP